MRYYQAEHESAYLRIERDGLRQWNDLFDEDRSDDVDDFPNRAFLLRVLGRLTLPVPRDTEVLEYGCGTAPAARFLAARGFRVDAVDLIPRAIAIAQKLAAARGLAITFGVEDVCDWTTGPTEPTVKQYDLVVDSYCLQSVVLDDDRATLLAGVRARLKPGGHYLLSTAMYDPDRRYDSGYLYDAPSGICYEVAAADDDTTGIVQLDGRRYLPHRRHLQAAALRDELNHARLRVVSQEGRLRGDVVCTLAT